jgi:phospho-N-acetylmuramoyl-pentapeptide-transferase
MSDSEAALTGLNAFWIAAIAATLAAWPVFQLLLRMKSRQTIDKFAPDTHQVKQGTPTMGGFVIIIGFLAALLWQLFSSKPQSLVESTDAKVYRYPPLLLACLAVFVLYALIGFADDFVIPRMTGKRGLGWKQKIVPEILFGAVGAWILSDGKFDALFGLALFLILFFSNAYNFSDGLDALSGSLLLTICAGLAGIGWFTHNFQVVALALSLVGAVIPFLIMNAPPAKVFMGDVGSLPIGAVLGLMVTAVVVDYPRALWESMTMPNLVPAIILSLVMVAELVPVPMQVAYYKLTKKRLFPYTPIHHAFEKKGWKETRVVWLFAMVQLLLSVAAVTVLLMGMGFAD